MSLNKVMLIGNVGKDPEIRYIDQGVCTAQISLATSTPGYTLQNGTTVPERTEWHSVYLWRRLAEVVERYVHKGDKLYIEGELRYRTYTDKKVLTTNKPKFGLRTWKCSHPNLKPQEHRHLKTLFRAQPPTLHNQLQVIMGLNR